MKDFEPKSWASAPGGIPVGTVVYESVTGWTVNPPGEPCRVGVIWCNTDGRSLAMLEGKANQSAILGDITALPATIEVV